MNELRPVLVQVGPDTLPKAPGLGGQVPEVPCRGPRPGPGHGPHQRPGYRVCHFVNGFERTTVGLVPRLKTRLGLRDGLGTAMARLGPLRKRYTVVPGLYCLGRPGPDAPVLVTANYKLGFDALRSCLAGVDAWLLVVDTRGINVWCAAGKGLFCAAEVARMVGRTRLAEVVSHRTLVLPQLCATGVSARQVRQSCGFEVVWGPVRAADLQAFLDAGMKADQAMRAVTFTLRERAVLAPVELYLLARPLAWAMAASFLLSGLGPGFFSWRAALVRGSWLASTLGLGVLAGAVAVPLALPLLPGRSLAGKGLAAAGPAALALSVLPAVAATGPELAALVLAVAATGSYLGMNFTGSTPYTSPSGVEKEMRRFIPLQAAAALAAVILWVGSAFWRAS